MSGVARASAAPAGAAAGTTGVAKAPVPRPMASAAVQAAAAADRADPVGLSTGSVNTAALPAGAWKPLGPDPIGPPFLAFAGFYGGANSGRVTAMVAIGSGTHAGRVVAASAAGGLWTSDNDGTTWTARTDHTLSIAIGSLAIDPANPDHLIAGTGEGNHCGDCAPGLGILSSVNGGTTWVIQNPGSVFTGAHVAAVAIGPGDSHHMFAATDRGLYVTTNSGTAWAKPTDPSYAPVDGDINAVVVDPSTPSTVYLAGGAATVAKSTNGGVAWSPASTGITAPPPGSFPVTVLAIAASSPSTLYASVGTFTLPVALYKTTNGGTTWAPVVAPDYTGQAYSYGPGGGTGEQGYYDNVVAVDPANASHVLAGGIALIETIDGGTTWTNTNTKAFFAAGTNRDHPDHHGLAFRADHKIWVGDDGGTWLYDPATNDFANKNGNLNITQFYHGFSEVAGTVLAGSQDNSSARTNKGVLAAWSGIFSGDGGPSAITPNQVQTQFVIQNSSLWMTTDGFATTFRNIAAPAQGSFSPPMTVAANAVDPTNPTVFYGGPDLYRTTNPAAATPTWAKVTTVGSFVSAIAVAPNTHIVYVAFEDGTIQVSTDSGVSFTSLAAQPFAETFVTGLSVNPANAKSITVSVSSTDARSYFDNPHVAQYSYTTTPASGTWAVITGNLPNRGAVSHVIYDNGALVAATDAAVYATAAPAGSSTQWTLAGTGLPNVQVQDVAVDKVTHALYAATHGRGVWKLPVLAVTTTTLPNGKVGTSYSASVVATGGTTPYAWSIAAGALPTGLALNTSTGAITGTPTTAGTASFTVQVTDNVGATATAPLSLIITA